jgi:hypothetical protein
MTSVEGDDECPASKGWMRKRQVMFARIQVRTADGSSVMPSELRSL